MKKNMWIMLICVGILFGAIFGWKIFKSIMMKRYFASQSEPSFVVSTIKVVNSNWNPTLNAVANMRAIVGVNVTTELAGMVQKIYFTPGAEVKQNVILVQLNADAEIGQLHALQAQSELAKITYKRDQAQFAVHAVSKQTVDSDEWNLRNLLGQVEQQAAIVDKKTIRAPFSGRLGISAVNPGQFLNVGDTVTTLQTIDPIYADFYLPQQSIASLKLGQTVTVTSDSYPKNTFTGKITTIQPAVDTATRNIEVEATVENHDFKLAPGMFTTVAVNSGKVLQELTVPQSAISFNPYGDIVYIVQHGPKGEDGKPVLTVKQVFVTTGQTRGDQIAVSKGIQAGDEIVSSGQLKLKNGSHITIDNTVQPSNNPDPIVQEE